MTIEDVIAAAPEILPLLPRLEKAFATIERVVADPDVKDAIAVIQELSAALAKISQRGA